MYAIEDFRTADGRSVYREWHRGLRDKKTKEVIDSRLRRVELGNLGDHKFCRAGVWELRIDFGPGYRIYYALQGETVLLLLCGGDKRTQSVDINRACDYWKSYQGENYAKRKS